MAKITENINSPNVSSRGNHIPRLIVCHIADGSYEGTKAWFNQSASQTSSHYIVGQTGKVCQCVALDKMAWCNGTTTTKGDNRYFGHSPLALVKQLGGNVNQYSVSIENEGYYAKTGGALTDAQLDALAQLILDIREDVKTKYGHTIPISRETIVGHFEINPITKPCCPGEKFPWSELMAKLSGQPAAAAGVLYRVQVGAFKSAANAQAYVKTVKSADLDAFVTGPASDGLYRVQVGAFRIKANAEAFLRDVKAKGFDAFIIVEEE